MGETSEQTVAVTYNAPWEDKKSKNQQPTTTKHSPRPITRFKNNFHRKESSKTQETRTLNPFSLLFLKKSEKKVKKVKKIDFFSSISPTNIALIQNYYVEYSSSKRVDQIFV